jgi:hypothetical protein
MPAKKKTPAWCWAIVLVVFGLLGTIYILWDQACLTPEHMEAKIARELRRGMSRDEVGPWVVSIARQGRDRSCLHVAGNQERLPSTVVHLARASAVDTKALAGMVVLSVPAARLHLMSSEDMFVYFFFDRQDRLLDHRIELRHIGR